MGNYHDVDKKRRSCCFIGHRDVEDTPKLRQAILRCVIDLILNENVRDFHFESHSNFDKICHSIVSDLKKNYEQPPMYIGLLRILYAYKSKEKPTYEEFVETQMKNFLIEDYEAKVELPRSWAAGKGAYIVRNKYMLDESDFVVFYYDKNHKPSVSENGKKNNGTRMLYEYAKKMKYKTQVINLCPETKEAQP